MAVSLDASFLTYAFLRVKCPEVITVFSEDSIEEFFARIYEYVVWAHVDDHESQKIRS